MFDQPGICCGPNTPKEYKIKIIFVREHFKIVTGFNLAARTDRLRNYQLATCSYVCRHGV